MTPPLAIDFIVAGGSALGLGHIMRSAAIAEAALRRGCTIRVFLDGDESAHSAWRIASPNSTESELHDWPAYPAASPSSLAFLDFPSAKDTWIATLNAHQAISIVLDDPRSAHLAHLTINPALHHGLKPLATESQTRSLDGPAYAILSEAHRLTRYRPWDDRKNPLLSIGGADPRGATHRLAPWISDTLLSITQSQGGTPGSPFVEKHAVLGAAFQDPNGHTSEALAKGGWRVHRSLPPVKMAELMASARIAVMGFGTSLIELAWHGTPHLSVTHHQFDIAHSEALETHGVGRHLGHAAELDPAIVKERLRRGLMDTEWQRTSAATARIMLSGGRGLDRILDKAEEMNRAARCSPEIPTAGARPF